MVLAILIAILIPALFFFLIWSSEIYATSRASLISLAFIWGMASFGLAFLFQTYLINHDILTFKAVAEISAPVLEESLKACLLLSLLRRSLLYHAVDGSIYGFAIGTGFAILENFLYISANPDNMVDVVSGRVVSTSLMHAFNSGFIGAVAGMVVYQSESKKAFFIGLILMAVMFIHFAFNVIASTIEGSVLIMLCAAIGIGGTVIFVLLLRRTLQMERQLIQEALEDHANAGELAAALDPQQLSEILYKQRHRIGEERIKKIQNYLVLKSRLALLKKALHFHHDSQVQEKLQRQIKTVEMELKATDDEMGLYTSLWLRTILPSEESEIWMKLDKELNHDNSALSLLVELAERREQIPSNELYKRIHLLRTSRLFSHLDEDDLRDIASFLEKDNSPKGYTMIEQGEVCEKLYIIASGRVGVSISNAEGDERYLWQHDEGDIFGHFSILDLHPYPAKVYCLEGVVAYSLARDPLMSLIYAKPQIAIAMMQLLIKEAREGSARLMSKKH